MSEQNTIKVKITSPGNQADVEITAGGSLEDALRLAGIDAEAQGLNVRANGAQISDLSSVTPQDGDQVVATPRSPKLG